jgi:hypothetical protein
MTFQCKPRQINQSVIMDKSYMCTLVGFCYFRTILQNTNLKSTIINKVVAARKKGY